MNLPRDPDVFNPNPASPHPNPHPHTQGSAAVSRLKTVAQPLRRLPVVNLDHPVVALVGAPNVGKSSLVNALSTGTPEVCNYPFTTRSIKMGHFFVGPKEHQITDTPGLLLRDEDERNDMERLTLAVLDHLPSLPVCVLDVTEECGTSMGEQWAIRETLRSRLRGQRRGRGVGGAGTAGGSRGSRGVGPGSPGHPPKGEDDHDHDLDGDDRGGRDVWLDVVTKEDLLTKAQREAVLRNVPDAIFVSSVTGEGLSRLQERVMTLVGDMNRWEEQALGETSPRDPGAEAS